MASYRRTLAAAVATILASISLYPIFTGAPLWFWDGFGAVIVVAAVGTLTRLRRLPVTACLAAGVAGLLLYLNAVFSSQSLLGVIPTGSSLRLLWDLAGQGFTQAARYAPPVPQLNGMLLLAVGGIGITALVTDLIAVRLQSAALAGLPLLALFTEPFTLSASRNAVGATVAFCLGTIGYLGLLSSEGRDRIREWEHPNPDPNLMPDTRALAAAGRRVGTASVVLALFVPLVVPGLHATQLFSSGQPGIGGTGAAGGTGAGVGFPDPDTQLSNELHTAGDSEEFAYTSSSASPDYFQIYVLDNLTGNGWQMFGQPESLTPADPRLPTPPGLTAGSTVTPVTTRITMSKSVGQDALGALPVPYPAASVLAPGNLQADRSSLMVFDPDVRLAALSYTVDSLEVSPPPRDLDSAAAPSPAGILSHDTRVPSSYDALRGLAESVVRAAGAKTPFEEAAALQQWLANGSFRYTLSAPTIKDANGLANFLENTKRGYCQQFSFAMAVLARLLGIPSRVAYGFTAGTPVTGNQWLVTTHDAHAWPELYFQGFGWLRFEPTPPGTAAGQGTATQPAYTIGPASSPQTSTRPTPGVTAAAPGATSSRNAALGSRLGLPFGGTGGASGGGRHGGVNPWEVLGLSILGLLVISVGGPAGVRLLIRRRRWLRARGARGGADAARAHAAWRELRDDLVDYRVGYLPSQSPRAVAVRAAGTLELAEPDAAALRRIAMAEERARYAAQADHGAGLRHDSAVVRRAVAAAVPRWTRWRARLMPSSVLSPALAAVGQAADIFGRLNPDWFGRARLGRGPRVPGTPSAPGSRPRPDEALVGQAPRKP